MKILLLLLSGLQLFDGIFTCFAVDKGMNEANTIVRSLIANGDYIIVKLAGCLICVLCLWLVYKRFPRLALTATSCVVLFYSAVLVWNTGLFVAM